MKLIITIIRDEEGNQTIEALVEKGFRVTRMASTGGFLRHGNLTLMIGVDDDQVQSVIDGVRQACCIPINDTQHHATIFVVDMPYFEQI